MQTAEDVLQFWFEDTEPTQWWSKDAAFDTLIRDRFGPLHQQVARCEKHYWRNTPPSRLAEIIVLDQFSRNIYRDRPESFAWDGQALVLAQEAVRSGIERHLSSVQCDFLYLPYMHSESVTIHVLAEELYRRNGTEESLHFELLHRDIIERFGRYPHRNAILERNSTAEELAFLKEPNSSF